MADHLGLIEMLSIFGIGLILVLVDLISTHALIRRDRKQPPDQQEAQHHDIDQR